MTAGNRADDIDNALDNILFALLPRRETGVAASLHIVQIRQELPDLIINGESTPAGVKPQHGGAQIRSCSWR